MRNLIKYIIAGVYKPFLVRYLSKARNYRYKGIKLVVPPEVFHPGFFSSTKLLLKYIAEQPLQRYSLLELGAGSGLISMYAAKKGAEVTATDINTVAIRYLHQNRSNNEVNIKIIHSDLFTDIPTQTFDYILINPPYYKKNPQCEADYAWYCGQNGEYFEQLFNHLTAYTHSVTKVFMVLCDGCDLEMIKDLALKKQIAFNCVRETRNWVENNFIFKLEPLK
jgi:release factor glutamine methyltransferase